MALCVLPQEFVLLHILGSTIWARPFAIAFGLSHAAAVATCTECYLLLAFILCHDEWIRWNCWISLWSELLGYSLNDLWGGVSFGLLFQQPVNFRIISKDRRVELTSNALAVWNRSESAVAFVEFRERWYRNPANQYFSTYRERSLIILLGKERQNGWIASSLFIPH